MRPVVAIANQVSSKPDDELEGLSDGGHNLIKCSNCEAILMDVWVTRPHEPHTYKLRATCPWCNDKSFVVKVKGGFHQGGYGTQVGDDVEETVESTSVERYELDDSGVFNFFIMKASANAKPVYK